MWGARLLPSPGAGVTYFCYDGAMSFQRFEARVQLPDETWAAFPRVQLFLSQDGKDLRIVIVPTAERVLLPGVVQDQPEALFLHSPKIFGLVALEHPWP